MKKFLKYSFLVLATMVLGFWIVIAQKTYRFDILVHPVSFYIIKNATTIVSRATNDVSKVDLIPQIFSVGDPLDSVHIKLDRAGYHEKLTSHQTSIMDYYKGYKNKEPPFVYYGATYRQQINTLDCDGFITVSVKFDESFKLLSAEGASVKYLCK